MSNLEINRIAFFCLFVCLFIIGVVIYCLSASLRKSHKTQTYIAYVINVAIDDRFFQSCKRIQVIAKLTEFYMISILRRRGGRESWKEDGGLYSVGDGGRRGRIGGCGVDDLRGLDVADVLGVVAIDVHGVEGGRVGQPDEGERDRAHEEDPADHPGDIERRRPERSASLHERYSLLSWTAFRIAFSAAPLFAPPLFAGPILRRFHIHGRPIGVDDATFERLSIANVVVAVAVCVIIIVVIVVVIVVVVVAIV